MRTSNPSRLRQPVPLGRLLGEDGSSMALPYHGDEDFARTGSYSPEEGIEPVRRIKTRMDNNDIVDFDNSNRDVLRHPNRNSQNSGSIWERFMGRVEAFRDYLSGTYCPSLENVPAIVLLMVAIILILAVVAIVSIVLALTYGSSQTGEPHSILQMQRTHMNWPSVEEGDPLSLELTSASALLPPNVTICDGFGFSCTNLPSLVVSTMQRCDGVADCPDGSDEIGCKACQTTFSCELVKSNDRSAHLMCLRGSSLCDGTNDCANNSDETLFCRNECAKGEVHCSGTKMCLPSELLCDGDVHCRGGDDELNCRGKCQSGSRWCKQSQRCIPKWQVCDGVKNCADGTDERNCSCKECSGSGKALCENSKVCLDRSRICDGIVDCPNGDDEKQCPGSCPQSSKNNNEMLLCSDGRHYNKKYACSGLLKQCEGKCSKCDAEIAFTCKNKKCVPRAMVCDGMNDCGDSSDEEACDCGTLKKTGKVIQCRTTSEYATRKCIPASRRCDGYEDCPGGDDERDCDNCNSNPEAIYCNVTRTCYPSTKRCDGFEDCPNGIDENGCTCDECHKQPYAMYMCSGSARCFPRSRVCSPYSRCPRATHIDKLFCANKARIARSET